jgi:hypothetical protein
MLVAREDEEIVCLKDSAWGRLTDDVFVRRPTLCLCLLRPAWDGARAGSLEG